jgi:hypothetical protein
MKIAAFDAVPTNDPGGFDPPPHAAAPTAGSSSRHRNRRPLINMSITGSQAKI